MGKLGELLTEFKSTPIHSTRDKEIREEIFRIIDWMKENGHLTKPFKLPKKYMKNYFPVFWMEPKKEQGKGLYCGHCGNNVSELTEIINSNRCPVCGWGLACLIYLGGQIG